MSESELPPSPDPASQPPLSAGLAPPVPGLAPEPASAPKPPVGRTHTLAVAMLIVGALFGYFVRPTLEGWLTPGGTQTQPPGVGPRALPKSQEEVMPYLISQTRHFKGDPAAPITVIEFADFQCPYCGLFDREAARLIEEQYVVSGKVRFGYLHFIFLGPESQWAAEASECAADQERFWEYHDLLFASQQGENQGAFNKDKLKGFASLLGLDRTDFDRCLDSGKYAALAHGQTQALSTLGVESTPTFVVNGEVMVGAQSFEPFKDLIEKELGN
jgi:protein-disulfide isomerase